MTRSFTISARGKPNAVPIMNFLDRHFDAIPRDEIDSIFGFVERSPLYGGRIFTAPELTAADVSAMYACRIGVRLPLTNHHVEETEYEEQAPLLEVFHRDGNAAIVTNDNLARWIRRDFPKYRIEASVIKNLKTHDRIKMALDLYDTVVLPMELNEDTDFLIRAPEKHRITLFANAGCALTCPSKICYMSISKINKTGAGEFMCSQTHKERDMLGMLDFDLDRLSAMGFSRFKVLRSRASGMTGH